MANMNNMNNINNLEWQTEAFRQSMVRKLEEALKESGPHPQRDPRDMEQRVFMRSKNREEYLGFIARCILMVKGERRNLGQGGEVGNMGGNFPVNQQQQGMQGGIQGMQQQQQGMGMQQGMNPGMQQQVVQQGMSGMAQQGMQQGMAQQGMQQQGMQQGMQQQGMQQQGIQQGMQQQGIQQGMQQQGIQQGMQQQGMQQQGMQQGMQQQGIQQGMQQGMAQQGMQQQGMQQQGMQQQGIQQQGMQQQGMQQQGIQQGMQQQGMQQQGIQQGMQQQGMQQQGMQQQGMQQQGIQQQNMQQQGLPQQGMQQQQQIRMQQQQQQLQLQQMAMNQGGMRPGMNQGGNVSQLQQRLTEHRMPNQMAQGQRPRAQIMSQVMMPGNRMPIQMAQGQMNPNLGMMNQGGSMMAAQQRGPAPPYMNPSPGGMVQTGGSPMMMQHGPSPGVQNQFIQSPGSSQSGMPSPGPRSTLAPSPMSMSIATPLNETDEQVYLDKVKQLSRYIEPLSKMIAKIGNEDQEKLGKMKKLMDILSNPSKRMPMETLLKCEAVLERMNLDAADHTETKHSALSSSAIPPISSSSITPLLEAIVKLKNHQKSALPLNHTLHRTLGAPIEALYGAEISLPPLPKRRRRVDPEEAHASVGGVNVPHVLQGEIARLQSHFKVSLDPAQPSGPITGPIQIVCQLEDRDLPSVPPLAVTIPHNYPDASPSCDTQLPEYSSTPFLTKVQTALDSRLTLMPSRYTLSQLLNAWEMSVRSACSPQNIPVTPMSRLLGL